MKAFLYARVSTDDQSEGMQVRELEKFAAERKWEPVLFTDAGWSGTKERRPGLDEMMRQARRRLCGVVLVYKFDRFARSLRQLINALEEFDALGIQFVSLHDQLDTTTPAGRLMFQLVAAFAEFEHSMIAQRVKSGMAHAKANGKHVGRPALGLDAENIAAMRAQGMMWYEIADIVGAGESTVRKFMRRQEEKGSQKPIEPAVDSKEVAKAVEN